MKPLMFFYVAIACVSIYYLVNVQADAMTECNKSHSWDVCFQELNR